MINASATTNIAPNMQDVTLSANGLEFAALRSGSGDRVALLLHGFPDDPGSMELLMGRLADGGYTTVAPYMRGYGDTDRPADGQYRVTDLARDALGLLDALDASDALLIGHDWGAAAAAAAAVIDPGRIDRLVTMAVPPNLWAGLEAHPLQVYRSWYMAFFCIPRIPERALRADDFALIERLWREWSPGWDYPAERLDAVKETFRTEGTVEAALAYYRQNVPPTQPSDSGGSIGPDVPWLVVAGERDGCIGPELFVESAGDYRVELVPEAGHFVQLEAAREVGELVETFAQAP